MKSLPKLPEPVKEVLQSCDDNPHRCEECPIYKIRCRGCIESGRREPGLHHCAQGSCATGCNTCGGNGDTRVPTVCCKSPLLKVAFPELDRWSIPKHKNGLENFHTSKPIHFANKGINMNQGSPGSVLTDPYPPETEVIAVSIRHVWTSTKGFIAGDLKAHMKIPPHVKLLVLCMTKDDVLEDLWKQDIHGGATFKKVNIDYWMPIMFSNYYRKGNMSNFFDATRSLRSFKLGHSQFIPMVFSRSLYMEDIALEAAQTVKNAVFNGQFLVNDEIVKTKLEDLIYWHKILPADVNFFIVGPSSGRVVLNIKRFLHPREVYFISVNPWMNAFYGKYFSKSGETKINYNTQREDLVWQNQRNYFDLCNVDVTGAPLSMMENLFVQTIDQRALEQMRFFDAP